MMNTSGIYNFQRCHFYYCRFTLSLVALLQLINECMVHIFNCAMPAVQHCIIHLQVKLNNYINIIGTCAHCIISTITVFMTNVIM